MNLRQGAFTAYLESSTIYEGTEQGRGQRLRIPLEKSTTASLSMPNAQESYLVIYFSISGDTHAQNSWGGKYARVFPLISLARNFCFC